MTTSQALGQGVWSLVFGDGRYRCRRPGDISKIETSELVAYSYSWNRGVCKHLCAHNRFKIVLGDEVTAYAYIRLFTLHDIPVTLRRRRRSGISIVSLEYARIYPLRISWKLGVCLRV